jgi:Na+-transporting methylmalonyl-CoA/oxaloacetate decarboxylase gamma subunit
MPAIVIVLVFLILFLLAFLVVLIGPFLGFGFAMWKHGKDEVALGSAAGSREQASKSLND